MSAARPRPGCPPADRQAGTSYTRETWPGAYADQVFHEQTKLLPVESGHETSDLAPRAAPWHGAQPPLERRQLGEYAQQPSSGHGAPPIAQRSTACVALNMQVSACNQKQRGPVPCLHRARMAIARCHRGATAHVRVMRRTSMSLERTLPKRMAWTTPGVCFSQYAVKSEAPSRDRPAESAHAATCACRASQLYHCAAVHKRTENRRRRCGGAMATQ